MTHPLLNRAANLLKATASFIVVALAFISATAFAEPAQLADWRQTLATGTGAALAQTPNGDYVTLGLESPNSVDAAYGANLVLQRHDSAGQPVWSAPVRWTTAYPGVRPYNLVVDATGNTFVLATEGDYNYTFCTSICGPPPPLTMFNAYWVILKYSPDGALLWQRRQLQAGVTPVQGVVDAAGDLYVAFDPNGAGRTAITSKLSGANGATVWTALTPDGAKPGAIALSSSETVLVAAAGTFFGLSINEYAQDSGARLTRTVYADAAGYYAPGMALGPLGEIAFTGKSANGLFLGLENAARQTVFTSSTAPGAQGSQVAVDALGRVVVAGTVPGTIGTNWLVARYDAAGSPAHAPVVLDRHASAAEAPLALVAAADGAAYITGAAGPGTGSDPNATQAVTVRLAANGSIDWVAGETAGLRGVGAALASDDSVAVLTAGGMSLVHYPVPPLNRAPTSAIRVASVSGLQVGFDASGSTDPDGTVASYRWTFGDGSSLLTSAPTITHSYPGTGTYTASVVAVDNLGLSGAAASTSVSVTPPPTPTALTLSSTSVSGGSSVTGKVTLSSAKGAAVSLSSSNPAVASVSSTVNVPVGSSSASFAIRTYKVRTNTAVTITATANGKLTSAVLTVKR
ncbi:MAG: PKD domain-containing protein [Albidovulum sp.]